MNDHDFNLLYTNDQAEVIGLYEMQLLDQPLVDRVPLLVILLNSSDAFVAFQAAEILAYWGFLDGASYFDNLLDSWTIGGRDMYPHRIDGHDESLDRIARAIESYSSLPSGDRNIAISIYRKLLSYYGVVGFAYRLKYALMAWDGLEMVLETLAAIDRAETLGRYYLASQLLPPLARWQGDECLGILGRFNACDDYPDPRINVAEALRYFVASTAFPLLIELSDDKNSLVADEAQLSLKYLKVRL